MHFDNCLAIVLAGLLLFAGCSKGKTNSPSPIRESEIPDPEPSQSPLDQSKEELISPEVTKDWLKKEKHDPQLAVPPLLASLWETLQPWRTSLEVFLQHRGEKLTLGWWMGQLHSLGGKEENLNLILNRLEQWKFQKQMNMARDSRDSRTYVLSKEAFVHEITLVGPVENRWGTQISSRMELLYHLDYNSPFPRPPQVKTVWKSYPFFRPDSLPSELMDRIETLRISKISLGGMSRDKYTWQLIAVWSSSSPALDEAKQWSKILEKGGWKQEKSGTNWRAFTEARGKERILIKWKKKGLYISLGPQ